MSLFDTAAPSPHPPQGLLARDLRPFEAESQNSARAWSANAFWLAVSSLFLFYGLALASWLLTGTVVPWDSKNHFYAMFRFLGDALHNGEIPLWNPYHFGGHPAIADPQSLIFTPTMLLFAWIAPQASMQVFDAIILAHLFAGGVCVVGLARRWRWHPSGAVLAAIVFMLGGAASGRLQHTGIIISYSFFPMALWCLDIALERRSIRFGFAFGLSAALMALGRDQVAFLLCAVLAGYVVFSALQSGNALRYLRTRAGVLASGGALILAILIIPALLTMQFLANSNRPGFPFGVAAVGSLAPVNLITLFAPNFFGSLDHLYDYWGPDYDTMPRIDWTDRAVDYLFIGTLPFLLIAWHGFGSGRLFARRGRFILILLGLSLAYALGRYTPFFAFAFDRLPGVSLYRRPADATFLMNIALALSAGFLLTRYIEDGFPRPFRALPNWLALTLISATALSVAVLIGSGLAFALQEGRLRSSLGALAVALTLAIAGAALLYPFQDRRWRALAASVFVLVSGAEILWRNAASSLNAEPLASYSVYTHPKPSDAAGIAMLRHDIDAQTNGSDRPRVEILGLKGPWQNASMVFKFENTLGYNPLRIDDYERAVGPGQDAEDFALRHYPGTFRGYNSRLAALLGLQYLILDRPLTELPREIPRPKADEIYAGDGLHIYNLGKTAPRVYFSASVKPVEGDDVLDEQVLPDFDYKSEVLIEQASLADLHGGPYPRDLRQEPIQTAGLGNDQTAGQATGRTARAESSNLQDRRVAIVNYTDNMVEIDADAPKAGIVVLHDLFYPGWEVRVDGRKQPVLRANILFRGVEVPAGHHHIIFAFRPLSLANLKAAASSVLHSQEE